MNGINQEDIKKLFSRITVWKRGDERAPHKPLLLLLALAKCKNEGQRLIPYAETDKLLKNLLIDFGPLRKTCHTEHPFWRLQNDGLWELKGIENIKTNKSNDVSKSDLIKQHAIGGFKTEIYSTLHNNPKLILSIAQEILEQNFPTSIHEDILSAVGLDLPLVNSTVKKRDANFRQRILVAYEYQCAICGFAVRLGNTLLGLEAAHIKWHQAGGPDTETNGLALCAIHHKMFDRGAFTLSEKLIIEVSEHINNSIGSDEWLIKFHAKSIRSPQSPQYRPNILFLNWHRKEVFRGPSRFIEKF